MIIAKYSLNGNANDSAGSNNGVSTNVTWVDGKQNGAGSFNGSSSRINVDTFSLNTASNFSFEVICDITNVSATGQLIQLKLNGNNNNALGIQITSTKKIRLFGFIGTTYTFTESANSYNGWITLGLVKSGSNYSLYVNGILVFTSTQGFNTFTADRCYIGVGVAAASATVIYVEYFNGKIDEVIIHNSSLTSAEIKNKYLAYNGFI